MLDALLATYPDIAHVIVTCRVRSYVGDAVLPDFGDHRLAPFDEEKIEHFVQGWYQAQVDLQRLTPNVAEARRDDLTQAALSDDLKELAENPMLLTTMAIIHQRDVGLPKERVRSVPSGGHRAAASLAAPQGHAGVSKRWAQCWPTSSRCAPSWNDWPMTPISKKSRNRASCASAASSKCCRSRTIWATWRWPVSS